MKKNIIVWISGGITSAFCAVLTPKLFPNDNIRFVFIDTGNESKDTYLFNLQIQSYLFKNIEVLKNEKYQSIQEVWRKFNSLQVASGAICSSELKRSVRIKFEKENEIDYQVFGFDISESGRALRMRGAGVKGKPIFPLLLFGYSKKYCIDRMVEMGFDIPDSYKNGFLNNNCLKTGCVQGGAAYWKKYRSLYPERYKDMVEMERELTRKKGFPVTIIRDQSKKTMINGKRQAVFLEKNPEYPNHKTINDLKTREIKSLVDCNGFCQTKSNK